MAAYTTLAASRAVLMRCKNNFALLLPVHSASLYDVRPLRGRLLHDGPHRSSAKADA
jgi:hypothetical protein